MNDFWCYFCIPLVIILVDWLDRIRCGCHGDYHSFQMFTVIEINFLLFIFFFSFVFFMLILCFLFEIWPDLTSRWEWRKVTWRKITILMDDPRDEEGSFSLSRCVRSCPHPWPTEPWPNCSDLVTFSNLRLPLYPSGCAKFESDCPFQMRIHYAHIMLLILFFLSISGTLPKWASPVRLSSSPSLVNTHMSVEFFPEIN